MANIENLKDDYNNEILKYLKTRFYEIIVAEKSRNNYKQASVYVSAIAKLNNGEKQVNELISELKDSEYSKRKDLFAEIKNAIK